jgi:hypothetical protein
MWIEGIAALLSNFSRRRLPHAVAKTSHGLNVGCAEFTAQPPNKNLDGIGIPVEILRVDVFGKFSPRYDPS